MVGMNRKRIEKETDIERLRAVALALDSDNRLLLQRLQRLLHELAAATDRKQQILLAEEIRLLNEKIGQMNQEKFSPSQSERRGRREGVPPRPPREPKEKTGHGPTPQPQLPIVPKLHPLDEADKICPHCGFALRTMNGQLEESQEITLIERHYQITLHQREKCSCGACGHIETALGPDKLIPGGRYSIEFAASVAVDKYSEHLPLARQATRMARQGLIVDRQTLWDQLQALSVWLLPVYQMLKKHVLAQPLVYADETTWRLMGTGATRKWWVWEVGTEDAAYVELFPSRGTDAASIVLEGYDGIVMADGLSTYKALEKLRDYSGGEQITLEGEAALERAKIPNFTLVICWMHARRPLVKAEKNYPAATEPLDLIAELYAIEAEAEARSRVGAPTREQQRAALLAARRELRAERSAGVIAQIQEWRDRQRVLPGSQLEKGVSFLTNQWVGLTRFLDDPQIPLDNGLVERDMRSPAQGRKNHQGSRSPARAQVSGLFYSLILSCRRVGVHPEAYLIDSARRAIRKEPPRLPHEFAAAPNAPTD